MKQIGVICNTESLAFPSIGYLAAKGLLAGVLVLDRYRKRLGTQLMAAGLLPEKIRFLKKAGWENGLFQWLNDVKPESVWVFGFPWNIPQELLDVPINGFINFHFGSFPLYRGADPMFWQLRNREPFAGLGIHRMTAEMDGGPVLLQKETAFIPGETYGFFCQRMGVVAAGLLDNLIGMDYSVEGSEQPKSDAGHAKYLLRPSLSDLTIDWQVQDSVSIEALVNACNPNYGGATTSLRGVEVRLLETMPVDIGSEMLTAEPGTIVYADALYGLIVACKDLRCLRINIVSMQEGYVSGSKLVTMGVRVGEKFI
ncbi:formyltransferase family protein [Mucilaginibacter lacusdianchii]|uniref:formyltransferase family protein n=1 Tax=Mucilaginibacter lacusdianchii TaxID=2684211 RepID=UPI00131D5917|nr:formyltransferase family protein [Mucilaginibacter sp. JXJ CY 39]